MNKEYNATVWSEDEVLEPEGGLSMEDLSADEEDDAFGDDQNALETSEEAHGEEKTAPTTEQDETDANGNDLDEAPTTGQEEETMPQKLKFKAKRDRKEENVELDFAELAGIYQKAQNYDRLQKKYNNAYEQLQKIEMLSAQLGFETTEDMLRQAHEKDRQERIQTLVDEGTNEMIAEDFVDRAIEKARSTKKSEKNDQEDADETELQKNGHLEAEKSTPDFEEQVADLLRYRPDLAKEMKPLPDEVVAEVVNKKIPLRIAYAEWEAKQLRAENERIRKEKNLFAQQAETASRAPVRGTADKNVSGGDKPDPWLAAFYDDNY